MIQEFHVSNFHSIREKVSISFLPSSDDKMLDFYTYEVKPGLRLLKLGVIYGANASGKTTILEAISYFRKLMVSRPSDKLEGMGFSPFMLDNFSRSHSTHMEMVFYIDQEKYILECEFNEHIILSEQLLVYSSIRPTLLYRREFSTTTGHSTITFGAKAGLTKKSQSVIQGNAINNCSVIAAFGQSNVETSKLDKVYNYFSKNMLEMLSPKVSTLDYIKSSLKEDENDALKSFLLQILKASDFNIIDFSLRKTENGIFHDTDLVFKHFGDGGDFILSENLESAGTKRFMGMAIILYNLICNNCFLLIDEVETSIHYELFSYFLKVFLANSNGASQLLMTTHDINLLDEDFIRRDVVWFTEKNTKGVTSIKRLSASGLHKTMSVYNAYRQGKLVDLPFLGSIFLDNE